MVLGLIVLLWSFATNLAAQCRILLRWFTWELVCGFHIGEVGPILKFSSN